jgi:plasmid stabilization system protein ParE
MRKAFLQQKAKEYVREIVLYIADDNLKAAEAFRLALERARLTLADLPEIGRVYDFGKRELKGLRMLPVPDFTKYLVFYVYRKPEEEVEIFHVLHGARDIPALFH